MQSRDSRNARPAGNLVALVARHVVARQSRACVAAPQGRRAGRPATPRLVRMPIAQGRPVPSPYSRGDIATGWWAAGRRARRPKGHVQPALRRAPGSSSMSARKAACRRRQLAGRRSVRGWLRDCRICRAVDIDHVRTRVKRRRTWACAARWMQRVTTFLPPSVIGVKRPFRKVPTKSVALVALPICRAWRNALHHTAILKTGGRLTVWQEFVRVTEAGVRQRLARMGTCPFLAPGFSSAK